MKNMAIIKTVCGALAIIMLSGCGKAATDTDLADKLSGKANASLEKGSEDKTDKDKSDKKKSKKKKRRKEKSEKDNDDEWVTLDKESGYMTVYEPVFTEVLDIINNGYDYEKQYKYVSDGLIERVMYPSDDDLLNDTGYIMQDISGDGVPELLIGYNDTRASDEPVEVSYILSVFSIKDNEPCTVFQGWARSSYVPLPDRHFFYSGSASAFSSAIGENHISKDGSTIEWDDFYFMEEDASGEVEVFHNTTGIWDREKSEKLGISEYSYRDMMERYVRRCVLYSWTPLGTIEISDRNK